MSDLGVTWREFKDFVDAELAQQGVSEDRPIWYIDVAFMSSTDNLTVVDDAACGIAI